MRSTPFTPLIHPLTRQAPPNGSPAAASTATIDPSATERPLPSAPRLAPPVRRRRPALWVLGAALVAAGGTVAGAAVLSAGNRLDVLAVARPVAAGDVIGAGDVRPARVAADPALSPIRANQSATVVGQHAAVDLRAGTLLVRSELTSDTVPGVGQALVGVALKPGQLPARPLRPGDRVLVVTVPDAASAAAGNPASSGAQLTASVAGVGAADANGAVVVDLSVDQASAPGLAADAAASRVALVLLARGSAGVSR